MALVFDGVCVRIVFEEGVGELRQMRVVEADASMHAVYAVQGGENPREVLHGGGSGFARR